MAIIKCKMCGGDLNLIEGASTAECEFCGSVQTVPKADDEKKLTLFARANRLRTACEFDKAAGVYEAIVADFPEEAEAYWGLVLCKYGIEYVDDPATGRKIPTCHRSSYDSVMDDGNLEQALENADISAQKLYREEAKTIEKIRKGILEVSSKEQPYDIFICYKETDPQGNRTPDSVIAQELYSALTDKGYRVFFSRITLQSKLGEAYEPYIFAALNSAKVMLAVGSCYEYYNAVWVKNEWSRYLKICAADKTKHLIPCYKNLDPEDMPKEFSHLQGANLGQMGAVQDILFNMEKYIPLQKQTVVQEKIVVGGSGDNKIASLLDRGNMALEDGDWAKADSFFEDVLNNDSKNAQAYLGKTLAVEKCRTIDAFARKRKEASQDARSVFKNIPAKSAHIAEIVSKYVLSGYVTEQNIRKLYECDLSYESQVSSRQDQYNSEEAFWENHKWLSKAEKFAVGTVAEHIQREKGALFATLSQRVKDAEAAEAAAMKATQTHYEARLLQADNQAEALYNQALEQRQKDYQNLLQIAKNSSSIPELTNAAQKFQQFQDYQDSKNLADHCRKRIAEEQQKLKDEQERQRILAEKLAAAKQKKRKIVLTIASAIAIACIAVAVVVVTVVIPNKKYNDAVALMESGRYEQAISAFDALGSHKDSQEQICKIYQLQGAQKMEEGNYHGALELFEKAAKHIDVTAQQDNCYYQLALEAIRNDQSGEAWLSQIQNASAFADYSDLQSLGQLFDKLSAITEDDLESGAEVREFEDAYAELEAFAEKASFDLQISEKYTELYKNVQFYGDYLTETGEYTTLFSDGSGGGYASLSISRYGLQIYGPGPGAYLKNGDLTVVKDGNAYYSSDSYTYTLREDGTVEIVEVDGGTTRTHYILKDE